MKTIVTISAVFLAIVFCAFVQQHFAPHPFKLVVPKGWPKPHPDVFAKNPLTEEGFQLGRKLFYDTRLSRDSNFACASCHQQFASFAHFEHDLSHGFNNGLTTRNAPVLVNLAWMRQMHWDGGINHLEVQPLAPITAPNEMAETIEGVLAKLMRDPQYPALFKAAFGEEKITSERMLRALAQFTGTIQSYNTKYDRVMAGKDTFTVSEKTGYDFFNSYCNSCHKAPLFTDNLYHNTGLPLKPRLKDAGRMQVTKLLSDTLKFKTPTLRNITVSAPYMHDGRFYGFGQVIDHYRNRIDTASPYIDPLLKKKIIISDQMKLDLISFLHTLRDDSLLLNPRFAPPTNGRDFKTDIHF